MAKKWTETEVELLRKLYPDFQNKDIAKWIGKTISSVSGKANGLGIFKSKKFFSDPILSGRTRGDSGKATWFKKGTIPFNKNRKMVDWMSPENIERVKSTQFKKGGTPHNTQPIGSERITADGYVEIKIGDFNGKNKNFVLKQRKIWSEHYGEIPEGSVVKFKDNNKLNFEINNLYLSTMLDNMNENFTSDKAIVKRYLNVKTASQIEKVIQEIPELISLKRQNILLNQKIKTQDAGQN